MSDDYILKKHRFEWRKFWNNFDIKINGNEELSKAIHGSIYFLISSLPSLRTNQHLNNFYGLSPTGLGRGGTNLLDYEGHSFWDTEIWMLPVISIIEPSWSRDLLHYRYLMLNAARDYANSTGYQGAR